MTREVQQADRHAGRAPGGRGMLGAKLGAVALAAAVLMLLHDRQESTMASLARHAQAFRGARMDLAMGYLEAGLPGEATDPARRDRARELLARAVASLPTHLPEASASDSTREAFGRATTEFSTALAAWSSAPARDAGSAGRLRDAFLELAASAGDVDAAWTRRLEVQLGRHRAQFAGMLVGLAGVFAGLGLVTARARRAERRALAALKESEARFRRIFVNLGDAAAFVGPDRTLSQVNPAFLRLFGYAEGEVVGQSSRMFYADPRDFEEQGRLRFHPEGPLSGEVHPVRYRRKDGSEFWGETIGGRVPSETGETLGYLALVRDITQRRAQEEDLKRLNLLYLRLSRVVHGLGRFRSRDEILQDVCDGAATEGAYLLAWVGWEDPETRRLVPVAWAGPAAGYLQEGQVHTDERPTGCGPMGRCFRGNHPVVAERFVERPETAPWQESARRHQLHSMAAFPLRVEGRPRAVLALYSGAPEPFSPPEVGLLTEISDAVSFALDSLERDQRRRAAEAALLESEERYRGLVESSADLIWEVDAAGRFVYCSPQIRKLLGFEPEEVLGRTPFEFMPPDEAERVQGLFAGFSARGESFHRLRNVVLHRGGSRVIVESSGVPVRDAEGRVSGYRGVDRDITVQVQAERRQSTQAAVSRALAEAATPEDATAGLVRILGEHEAWDQVVLWRADETGGGLHVSDVWSADGRAPSDSPDPGLAGEVFRSGTAVWRSGGDRPAGEGVPGSERCVFAFPVQAGRLNTGVVELRGSGCRQPDALDCTLFEVIGRQVGQFLDRHQAQASLRRFIARSPAVLYALRIQPGAFQLLWVSENIQEMTGYPAEHCFDRRWYLDGIHPEDRAREIAAEAGKRVEDHRVSEFRFRRRDGTYLWVRDETRLVRDRNGQPAELLGSWSDVTARVELETQLRQSQKMESLGHLAGGIAHDFNNLLAIIQGNAELALEDVPATGGGREFVEQILQSSGRAKELVRQILLFSRQQTPSRSPLQLETVVEEAARLLRASIPSGVEVNAEIAPGLPAVLADPVQIQQMLLNLGTNAWHALENRPGGCITIRLGLGPPVETTTGNLSAVPPGPQVELSVSDNGRGIEPGILERIFDPFFTTKPPGQGTGLGLSVVHSLVQLHRGTIDVSSRLGEGTTFRIRLPALPPSAGVVAAPGAAAGAPQAAPRRRLLLLDDDAPLLRASAQLLGRMGFIVTPFGESDSLVAAFSADPSAFDVALLDQNMPGTSGLHVARDLLRIRPDLPVLLNSGFVSSELENAARAAGIREVLQKPNSAPELRAALERLWA